jgi:cytochrome P450
MEELDSSAPDAGAAFSAGWDPYAIALQDDPHPDLARLREASGIHASDAGVFLITRWGPVEAALRAPELGAGRGVTESFRLKGGLVYEVTRTWLMSLDGHAHQRARDLIRREFTPRRIADLAEFIETTAARLARGLADAAVDEPIDLVSRFAFALPSEVIRHLFEIDPSCWREQVEPCFDPRAAQDAEPAAALAGLAAFFSDLVHRRRPRQGLLAQLAAPHPEHGHLSDDEIVANAVLLVTAAIDTTTGLLANTILCLLRHPEQLARLRAQPDAIDGAIEETLRFEPPALSCSRRALQELELDGVRIPEGSELLLSLAAANRDPRRHRQPDRFDSGRADPAHLTFGGGRHVCLGAALARLEARVAVGELLDAAPALALEGPMRWRRDNPTVRAPRELHVRCRSADGH